MRLTDAQCNEQRQEHPGWIERLKHEVEQGAMSAEFQLGNAYEVDLCGIPPNYAEAAKWYSAAAEQGLEVAQLKLATFYESGKGVPQDWQEAYFWFTIATRDPYRLPFPHSRARRDAAANHLTKEQKAKVTERAAMWKPAIRDPDELLRQKADQGDLETQIALCDRVGANCISAMEHGDEKAFQIYSNRIADSDCPDIDELKQNREEEIRRAQYGNVDREYELGWSYYWGECGGVLTDYTEAYFWLSLALRNGPASRKGINYEFWRGDAMKRITAEQKAAVDARVSQWKKARGRDLQPIEMKARNGDTDASLELADLYNKGVDGVRKDVHEETNWLLKAAELGSVKAQLRLAQIYREAHDNGPPDWETSFYWMRRAAELGDTGAQYQVARDYENGIGVKEDYTEASKWFRKAADHGERASQFELARLYAHGEGVPQSNEDACFWFFLGAGRNRHQDEIDEVVRKLSPDQINAVEERVKQWKPSPDPTRGAHERGTP
jgi:uncharacterized protein